MLRNTYLRSTEYQQSTKHNRHCHILDLSVIRLLLHDASEHWFVLASNISAEYLPPVTITPLAPPPFSCSNSANNAIYFSFSISLWFMIDVCNVIRTILTRDKLAVTPWDGCWDCCTAGNCYWAVRRFLRWLVHTAWHKHITIGKENWSIHQSKFWLHMYLGLHMQLIENETVFDWKLLLSWKTAEQRTRILRRNCFL